MIVDGADWSLAVIQPLHCDSFVVMEGFDSIKTTPSAHPTRLKTMHATEKMMAHSV